MDQVEDGDTSAAAEQSWALRRITEAIRGLEVAKQESDEAVASARQDELSWAAIAELFGVSRQAAWERFGKPGRLRRSRRPDNDQA